MCTANCAGFIDPIYAYNHDGESAAVTGGPVYRADMFPPEYQGTCSSATTPRDSSGTPSSTRTATSPPSTTSTTQAGSVVDLKVAPDGSLYYITYWPGRALPRHLQHRVAPAGGGRRPPTSPRASSRSRCTSRAPEASDPDGDPLSYQWAFGDGTTSTDAEPDEDVHGQGRLHRAPDRVGGRRPVAAQPIVIQVGIPPALIVAAPTEGQLYRAGDTITYNAFATDAAGFDLNDADIKTEVGCTTARTSTRSSVRSPDGPGRSRSRGPARRRQTPRTRSR